MRRPQTIAEKIFSAHASRPAYAEAGLMAGAVFGRLAGGYAAKYAMSGEAEAGRTPGRVDNDLTEEIESAAASGGGDSRRALRATKGRWGMKRLGWGVVGVGIFLAGCVGFSTAGPAFAADTSLVVYSANDTDLNNFVFGMFQKETGTAVQSVTAGSGVLLKRMAAEKDRPLGDVLWGVSTAILDANKEYFEPYATKNAEAVPATFRDAGNLWIGTNAHVIVIQVNRKLLGNMASPRTWRDLQNPEWKGKVVMADPGNSGGAFTQVTRMIDLFGGGDKEKGWQELEKVIRNVRVLNKISLVYTGVGNGEYPVGLSLEYAAYEYVQGGAPVEIVYPEDGTVVQVEGMGIIKGAQHPEASRKFEDFITRKDVREAILKKFFRRPARTDLDFGALGIKLPPLKDIKLASYDFRGWAKDRDAVLQRVQDMILRTR